MPDLSTFTLASTVAAIFGIALGVLLPAFAMGRAISSALEALARQPEAERAIMPVSYTHLTLPTTLCMCRSRWSPYH